MLVLRCIRHRHFGSSNPQRLLTQSNWIQRQCYSEAKKPTTPLRVLFCGSDDFSITCLKALREYAASADSNVLSIDVATKTDKRTGRGLKHIRPPAIKPVAQALQLRLHQFDTFTGWELPNFNDGSQNIDLIVAVSFGLFVPPRILKACRYGGINVHPSMLPDLKGSAPIEHAILNGYEETGVTVQTLHPAKFDEGRILAQTPLPGLKIHDHQHVTASDLRKILAPVGAEMLVKVIRDRLYLGDGSAQQPGEKDTINFAPKISTGKKQIQLATHTAQEILRMNRAIPKLWLTALDDQNRSQRIVLGENIEVCDPLNFNQPVSIWLRQQPTGLAFTINSPLTRTSNVLYIHTLDKNLLSVPRITVSGMREGPGGGSVIRAKLVEQTQVEGSTISILRTSAVK